MLVGKIGRGGGIRIATISIAEVFCHRSKGSESYFRLPSPRIWHWEEGPPEHLALRKQGLTAGAPKNWEKDTSLLDNIK